MCKKLQAVHENYIRNGFEPPTISSYPESRRPPGLPRLWEGYEQACLRKKTPRLWNIRTLLMRALNSEKKRLKFKSYMWLVSTDES